MSYNDLSFYENNLIISEKYNTKTERNGSHHVRILKSFTSPKNNEWLGDVIENKSRDTHQSLLKKFPLRFYLPKDDASKKCNINSDGYLEDPRIKHLVIFINGLDEYKERYLKLYDALGSMLSERNIASVLLSTPYHLHRTVKYDTDKKHSRGRKSPIQSIFKPSDIIINNWNNVYSQYDTTYHDILELIKCIKGKPSDENKNDYNFYNTHFSKETKISILGYSLGGLFSFGCYLQNSDKIDKCILFNAPGNLRLAQVDGIGLDQKTWQNTWNTFVNEEDHVEEELIKKGNSKEYARVFLDIVSNNENKYIRQGTKKNGTKILQIVCGGDAVIDMKPWSKYFDFEEKGVVKKLISQHIFSGIGHLPTNESRGSELLPNIATLISDHVLSDENQLHWQEVDINKILIKLLKKITETKVYKDIMLKLENPEFDKSFKENDLNNILSAFDEVKLSKEKPYFLKFYHLYHLYNMKFYDLLEIIKNTNSQKAK